MFWFVQLVPLFLLLACALGENNATECYGVRCMNGGSVNIDSHCLCLCRCPDNFTGIICETKLEASLWPDGPFVLPMSKYGCPETKSRGWHTGYISVVTRDPIIVRKTGNDTDLEHMMNVENETLAVDSVTRGDIDDVSLLGAVRENGPMLRFCGKMMTQETGALDWPPMVTVVYRLGGICPKGFLNGPDISMVFSDVIAVNRDGFLPDLDLQQENNMTAITIYTCIKNTSTEANNSQLYDNVLVPKVTEECPDVEAFVVKHEVLQLLTHGINKMVEDLAGNMTGEDGWYILEYCFYKQNITDDVRLRPLMEDVPDIENFYQVPFQTRNNSHYSDKFWRSYLLYGIQLHSISPPMTGQRVIVNDLYGIHSYTGESGILQKYKIVTIPTQPFFNIPDVTTMTERPWIILKLQGIHTVTSVYVALTIEASENPEILANNSYLPEPEISICNFDTEFWTHEAFVADFSSFSFYKTGIKARDYYPHVWNFDLPTPHVMIEHRFTHPMRGQYLMISYPSYSMTDWDRQTLLSQYFNRMVGINIMGSDKDGINYCGSPPVLQSYQFTVSSSHPSYPANNSRLYDSGWCAEQTDTQPYIQVDMIFPTVIGGIKVVNLQSIGEQSLLLMGVKSLRLEYGFDENNLIPYGDWWFEVDITKPVDYIHTFIFEEEILARYIRIYPTALDDLDALPCLTFDLIQCYTGEKAHLSMDCSEDFTVVNTSTTYVSFTPPMEAHNSTSWDECKEICDRTSPQCSVFEFREINQSCLMFEYNKTASVRTLIQNKDSNSTLSTKLCLKDTGESNSQRIYHAVDGEGTITSPGFPFSYQRGQVITWAVTVDEGMFVQLMFINISLNVYQNYSECEDKISVSWTQYGLYQAERELEYVNPIKKQITASYNGEYVTYWGNSSTVYITFETCEVDVEPVHFGKGFRVLVRQTDTPFCTGGWDIDHRFNMPCTQSTMYFASPTWLDSSPLVLKEDYEVYYLHIFGYPQGNVRYVELMITDLEIPCRSDYIQFIIDDIGAGTQTSYCTFDRPPYVIKSTLWGITIKLIYTSYIYMKDYTDNKWHGFYGHYRFVYNNETVYNWTTSIEEQIAPWEYDQYGEYGQKQRTVCSDKFGSCYTLFPTLQYNTSWNWAQKTCISYGQNLVSLNTEDEYHYVRLMAENYTRYVDPLYDSHYIHIRVNPGQYEFHIGMTRFQDGPTMTDMWLDGSPVIFSSWASGQPSNTINDHCTKLHILPYNADKMWYTSGCDSNNYVRHFICEKPIYKAVKHSHPTGRLGPSEPDDTIYNMYKPGLFRCSSGEFLSWISVCNGFPECADNSDETGCSQGKECGEEEFRCDNGRCISYNLVCDDYVDCPQGEDEFCSMSGEDGDIYHCDDGQIVSRDKLCNGQLNCFDRSDEKSCMTCSTWSTQCFGLDRTCLPRGRNCDGYTDCRDGKDEISCSKYPIKSCDDWWGLGGKENGVYEIDGSQVLCNFDHISSRKTITYVPVHLVFSITGSSVDYFSNTLLTYDVNHWMLDLMWSDIYTCNITVLEALHPAMKKALTEDNLSVDMDQIYGTLEFGYYDLRSMSDWWIRPLLGSSEKPVAEKKRLLYNDVICENYFWPTTSIGPCSSDFGSVSTRSMCKWGWCRNLVNLWNCEDYVCPWGMYKCPGSFCIGPEHVCDGRVHCPGREDELFCYCKDYRRDVHIISTKPSDDADFASLYKFAQQFVSDTNEVSLNFVSDVDQTLIQGVGYVIDKFHLESEKVQTFDYRILSRIARTQAEGSLNSSIGILDFILEFHGNDSESGVDVITVDDDLANFDYTIWDLVFPPDKLVPDDIKSYRIIINEDVHRTAAVNEHSRWRDVMLRKKEFLQYGGSFLFKDTCKVWGERACTNGYVCQVSRRCLPHRLVCDGTYHCPHGDDERICGVWCPWTCDCRGHIVDCRNRNFTSTDYPAIPGKSRILDLSQNRNLSTGTLRIDRKMATLIKLNLSDAGLTSVDKDSFVNFPALRSLDLSNNLLTTLPTYTFWHLKFVSELHLSGNRFLHFLADQAFRGLDSIRVLEITGTNIEELTTQPFDGLNLGILDMSDNLKLKTVSDGAFSGLTVKQINFENCPIKSFSVDMFIGMTDLEEMATPAFKFCCIRPETVLQTKCTPFQDEFSSCEDLMRDVSQRALLWIIGLLALIGNSLVLIYRLIYDRTHLKLGHGIFVTNLAISDWFMGLYLIIVALADQVFRDRYIWMEDYWRSSGWCTLAGILSTVSSESSILFISLITLDRILVIKFPFGQVRFRTTTALASVAACWVLVILLSTFPLMFPEYFQNEFYSKSGVCIALPLTRERYPGWLYSIVIFVGFNFVTFMLIALGQMLIFQEVRKSSKKFKKGKSTRGNDLKVARNLLLVVSTDFLCWGPVGIMGLMSIAGSTIPPTVYAWTAVLILPVNSALNPFLYTVSALVNKNAFKPRLDEQTKLGTNELVLLKRMVQLFKAQTVFSGCNEERNERAIAYITKLSTVDIGKTALKLAICLRFLHRLHLKLDGVSFIPVEKGGISDDEVPFIVDPSLRANDKEMAEDMYKFGKLVENMLEKR